MPNTKPKIKKGGKKKIAAVPSIIKKTIEKKKVDPLIESRPRKFGIGQAVLPKRDLTHFIKWPKYIQMQRKLSTLKRRLKIPPAINQFRHGLDKDSTMQVLRLLEKHRPQTALENKIILKERAAKRVGGEADTPIVKKKYVVAGLRHVTQLILKGRCQLVVMAHDVDPIEVILFLPALCRKHKVPYMIIKGKARLGQIVKRKTCAVMAVKQIPAEDKEALAKLQTLARNNFNDRYDEIRKSWGGSEISRKSQAKRSKHEKARLKEKITKLT